MSSPDSAPPQTFDDLLTLMGTGRWNVLYIAALILRLMIQPSHALSGVYLAPWQDHTCRPHPAHLNLTRSRHACHYVIERPVTGGELNETEEVEVPCSQWDYDFSTFTSSLTSDYDLVCQQDHLRALYQSLYMMGTTVSPVVCGYLADRFGRMKVLVATQIALSTSSIAICFLHSLPLIFFLRLILGFSEILTGFVLTLEVCEPKHRVTVGILSGIGWSLGTMIWGGLAYLLRAWRSLQLAASLPTLLTVPLLLVMDESPRWLIVNGQSTRAKQVLRKASRWNKVALPPEDQLNTLFSIINKEVDNHHPKTNSGSSSYKGFWRPRLLWNRDITVITLVISLCYFCVALVYDGLNLAGELYSDNLYLYLVLGGLAEIPGIILAAPVVHRLGRKAPVVACLLGCGVVNIAISFLQAEARAASFTAAMIGKLLVTAAFQIIYLYSSELFPTEVRTSGVDGASALGQVGAVLAPYFSTYLGPLVPWLPSAVYGVISLVTGATTMLLRETKDRPLPETLEDLRDPEERKMRKRSAVEGGGVEKSEKDGEPDVSTNLCEQQQH